MTTIQINDDVHITVKQGKRNGQNRQFADVYVKGEQSAIFSQSFKETTPHSVIKIWATESTETLYHYERLDNL